jgi:hypothetical protein
VRVAAEPGQIKRARAFMRMKAQALVRVVCPAQRPAQSDASTRLTLRQSYRTRTAGIRASVVGLLALEQIRRNFNWLVEALFLNSFAS